MWNKPLQPYCIKVGARASPLSRIQVTEVAEELKLHHPHITFETTFVTTYGDSDRTTSLRHLNKTDFFTREIDHLILQGIIRLGIHSAKDLPDPLPKGLQCVGLTQGLDASDALVLRSCAFLPEGARVATSSWHREQAVLQIAPHVTFVDIRGTIGERLEQLASGQIDGVVIAEAALIRLKLQHLPRLRLPGTTTPLQGRLAILAAQQDEEMEELFMWAHPGLALAQR